VKLLIAALLLLAPATAAELETWETFEAPLVSRERVTVIAHSQMRQRQHVTDLFQARIGPVFRVRLLPRIALVGGYYYGQVEQTEHHWGNTQRTFAGMESPVAVAGGVLTGRALVEHHFGGGGPASVRFRQRAQWTRPVRSLAVFGGAESFFDQRGFFAQRLQSGVRLPFRPSFGLEFSYLYEFRVERIGSNRQAIQVALRPRQKG
jgi:hypothetical protein